VSPNSAYAEVYSIQHYVIKFVSDLQQAVAYPVNATFSTNKTDSHDIIEKLLKVALKIKTLTHLCSDLKLQ